MSYFDEVLVAKERKKAVSDAVDVLSLFQFSHIVVIGVSGVSMGAVLAHVLGKDLIVVRKLNDKTHSDDSVEMSDRLLWTDREKRRIGNYIIVDDFVESGDTLKFILDSMENKFPNAVCIGFWGYGNKHKLDTKVWEDTESSQWSIKPKLDKLGIENLNILHCGKVEKLSDRYAEIDAKK